MITLGHTLTYIIHLCGPCSGIDIFQKSTLETVLQKIKELHDFLDKNDMWCHALLPQSLTWNLKLKMRVSSISLGVPCQTSGVFFPRLSRFLIPTPRARPVVQLIPCRRYRNGEFRNKNHADQVKQDSGNNNPPRGKDRLPTTNFQGQAAIFREAASMFLFIIRNCCRNMGNVQKLKFNQKFQPKQLTMSVFHVFLKPCTKPQVVAVYFLRGTNEFHIQCIQKIQG